MTEEKSLLPKAFAVYGVFPETGAYSMSKYSRSTQSMEESLKELSEQQAAEFLETFYFQYGHKSIADLAHIMMALENFSIAHALVAWNEQLFDGQERSTRYQNFRRSAFITPPFPKWNQERVDQYHQAGDGLFKAYNALRQPVAAHLGEKYGAEAAKLEFDENTVNRTLNARSFDRIRYLLPMSTRTSLGLIANARTWEKTVVRLYSSPHEWVRQFGGDIKKALVEQPAYNLTWEKLQPLLAKIPEFEGREEVMERIAATVGKDLKMAPTLIKYTAPSEYQRSVYEKDLKEVARQYLGGITPDNNRGVTLSTGLPMEVETAATLLYRGSNHSFNQVLGVVEGLSVGERKDITYLATTKRGRHDELIKEAWAGYGLIYDVCMDIGAARDLRRHRRCIQVWQDFTDMGYDTPIDIAESPELNKIYVDAMDEAMRVFHLIEDPMPGYGQFILPLGARCRFLMKMDSGEGDYIEALRSGVTGHESYREVAVRMHEEETKEFPSLTAHTRVTPLEHQEFWKR